MDLNELLTTLTTGWGDRLAILIPMALLGLVGLYVAYLVMGYLKSSQVGLEAEAVVGEASLPTSGTLPGTSNAPYCPVDGLQHPPGSVFCVRCEADLVRACVDCGTVNSAASSACLSCGAQLTA